ncbi:hypothetical protein ROE7235_03156 [Roseibaca ekhonensis]|jgi:hypothetical protein|uniref:Uncharacterized protein n=1 Tax=Roseinatronobacter ekhonensis TaxID=254356 RepID=A0A3B0N022_9RHOB|nr:hypothetical protein [Roseibaca ekhonensis]SUZ33386.1 hypothetical protein ROE7235_03156 [Roseibaca ekhonensis]
MPFPENERPPRFGGLFFSGPLLHVLALAAFQKKHHDLAKTGNPFHVAITLGCTTSEPFASELASKSELAVALMRRV